MLDLSLFNVEEEIQRLREIRMLEWIGHLRHSRPPCEGTGGIPFTVTVRNEL